MTHNAKIIPIPYTTQKKGLQNLAQSKEAPSLAYHCAISVMMLFNVISPAEAHERTRGEFTTLFFSKHNRSIHHHGRIRLD
jgi:hypothetical protein